MTLIQQQRLLGAALLLCLIGVIAWLLLDTVEQNQPVPPQPEPIAFDSVIEPIQQETDIVEPVEEALVDPEGLSATPLTLQPSASEPSESASAAAPTQETTATPATTVQAAPEPAPVSEPEPETERQPETAATPKQVQQPPAVTTGAAPQWLIQLGSFSVRDNADALSAQLKQMGYQPIIETVSSAGTLIYRVRLQPESDRAKLEQTARTLSEKLKLNAQILQHNP